MHPEDGQLDASAVGLREPEALGVEVAAMIGAASRAEMAHRRRWRHGVTVASTMALLAGGGAVAAATGIWTTPWAADPIASITYTLPSGTVCEDRLGDLVTSDPALTEPLRDWLTSAPLVELADVDGAIAWWREHGEETYTLEGSGGALPAGTYKTGWGTAYYDADTEYLQAVRRAVATAIDEKIATMDGVTDNSWGWSGESHCTGPSPDAAHPWYTR